MFFDDQASAHSDKKESISESLLLAILFLLLIFKSFLFNSIFLFWI